MLPIKSMTQTTARLRPWLNSLSPLPGGLRNRRRSQFISERLEQRVLPAQIIVTSLQDNMTVDGFVTLREALEAANDDISIDGSAAGSGADEILFAPELDAADVNTGALTLQLGALFITAPVQIRGNSAVKTALDAANASRLFEISADAGDVTLANLTLSAGVTNAANDGYADNTNSGGAIHSMSPGRLLITDCRVQNNSTTGAFANGGAIFTQSGSIEIRHSFISSNSVGGGAACGGAIFTVSGTVLVSHSVIASNSTDGLFGRGGAIATESGNVQISDSDIQNNNTTSGDAAGGAISTVSGQILIQGTEFNSNRTNGINAPGGAVYSDSGTITIENSRFTLNSTQGDQSNGGAVATASSLLTALNSTLDDNFTAGAAASGGALYSNTGTTLVIQSTLSGNIVLGAETGGGGIAMSAGSLQVIQSTITGNKASGTVANLSGGGILAQSGTVVLENSIVAGNLALDVAPDMYSPLPVELGVTYSLIGRNNGTDLIATSGTSPDNLGNYIGGDTVETAIDPLLGPLQSNGGRSPLHAPQPGSLAINRGSNALATNPLTDGMPLTTDQRLLIPIPRIIDDVVDIGALEVFSIAGPLTVTINTDEVDTDVSSSDLSLREAILLAGASPGADVIRFADSTNAAEFDLSLGQMVIRDSLTLTGNGQTRTVLDAQQSSRIFDIASSAASITIENMTLKNARTVQNGMFWADEFYGGGAVRSAATGGLSLSQITLSGNATNGDYAPGGALLAKGGPVSISRSLLSGNSTSGYGSFGGAVSATQATNLTISETTVTGNMTTGRWAYGGGVYSDGGTLTISRSTLSGNKTLGSGAVGGAVAFYDYSSQGKLIISNSTISGNQTLGNTSSGGGVYSSQDDVIISQSTLSGNSTAGTDSNGAGLFVSGATLYQSQTASVLISQSTITQNSTAQGIGGGVSSGANLILRNTILAGNTDSGIAPDFEIAAGKTLSSRYSLIGRSNGTTLTPTTGSVPDSNGNFVGGDIAAAAINPQLGPLQNNGGGVFTHLPLTGSRAIDRGLNSLAVDVTAATPAPGLLQDQRGTSFTRILDGDHLGSGASAAVVDIGAAEFSGIRLTSPNPNAFTVRPTFRWTAIAGAVSYDIHINNESTGTARFHMASSATNVYTPVVDLALGKFTMWIRPNFATGTSNWSAPQTFFLLPPVTWKTMDRTQLVSRPTLQWNAIPGAVKYDLWGNNYSTGQTQTVRTDVLGTSWTPPADLPMGIHRFWIRAFDAKGNAGTWAVLYEALVVPSVTGLSPGTSTFDRTPEFTWTSVTGAAGYELFLKNQNTGSMVINGLPVAGTSYTPAANLPDGPYRWWVLAVSPASIGSLRSGGANNRDLFVGGRTSVTAPVGTILSRRPTFAWQGVDGAASYTLFVTRTSSPTGTVLNVPGITALNYTPEFDLTNGNFRVWVRAVTATGDVGPWSNPVDFSITQLTSLSTDPGLPEDPLQQLLTLLPRSDAQPATRRVHEQRATTEQPPTMLPATTNSIPVIAIGTTPTPVEPISGELLDLWMQQFSGMPEWFNHSTADRRASRHTGTSPAIEVS